MAKKPVIRMRADSTTLLRALTYEENFLCMLPDKVAEADVKAGRLVRVSQKHLTSSSEIVIAYSSFLVRTSVVRNLMATFFQESASHKACAEV
jgi:DNA-binding transcriptional LysR family regulator